MHPVSKPEAPTPPSWDPLDVWRRLLREYPIRIDDPAGNTGRMDRRHAKLFWVSVAEYPDPLQDVLFVIAHARGFEAAVAALDQAIRTELAKEQRQRARAHLVLEQDAPDRVWLRRAAS